MRHSLCLRMAHLICLGSFILVLWGCATHTSPAGTSGRHTLTELLRARDPGAPSAPPETPTAEDWQLWTTIKARWPEVEQMGVVNLIGHVDWLSIPAPDEMGANHACAAV
jgi:hypothetical protein